MPIHGTPIGVDIEIPDLTFVEMPVVRITDRSALPLSLIAHIEEGGNICYFGQSGLPLDLYNPGGSVLRVLEDAAAALELSYGGGAKNQFEAELASYWKGNRIYVAVGRNNAPKIIQADLIAPNGERLVIVERGGWKTVHTQIRLKATILTFGSNLTYTAAFPPKTLQQMRGYIESQTAPAAGWDDAILTAAADESLVFLSAPNAIIGWNAKLPTMLSVMKSKRSIRPEFFRKSVRASAHDIELDRKSGVESDLRHCIERNLHGQASLVGRNISLIGCGTIGGYLARLLAQSGAGCDGTLTLFDIDVLTPGNLGRHSLGFSDLGKLKALAIAENLKAFHPDVSVHARATDALKSWEFLAKADLIIDATGEPNVSTALNDKFMNAASAGQPPAILHTWVFGNGVAAQSFLNLRDGGACYRCLKTGFDGEWRYNPLKDPSSPLRQAPASCGDAGYTPFAVDAPLVAAGLTLRAALDWAAGTPGKHLRTVIVDHHAGREREWVSPSPLSNCPACGA